jgi:hypothetical protein
MRAVTYLTALFFQLQEPYEWRQESEKKHAEQNQRV